MTINQLKKKIEVARKCGSANLDDGSVLEYGGTRYGWTLVSTWKEGGMVVRNVVDTAHDPMKFSYICG